MAGAPGRGLEASIKAALRHLPAPAVPVEAPDSPGESQRAASKLQEAGARVEELNASLEANEGRRMIPLLMNPKAIEHTIESGTGTAMALPGRYFSTGGMPTEPAP